MPDSDYDSDDIPIFDSAIRPYTERSRASDALDAVSRFGFRALTRARSTVSSLAAPLVGPAKNPRLAVVTNANPFADNSAGAYDSLEQNQNTGAYGGGLRADETETQSMLRDDERASTYTRDLYDDIDDEGFAADVDDASLVGRGQSFDGHEEDFFEDDIEMLGPNQRRPSVPYNASLATRIQRHFSGLTQDFAHMLTGAHRVYEGERTIVLNEAPDAKPRRNRFLHNSISTSKYNFITFIPIFLAEQFSKSANVFFLFTFVIQQIPDVSPVNRWTTIAPLALVILVAAWKEAKEDIKRHQSDAELNSKTSNVLVSGRLVEKKWKNIKVGDIVRVQSNEPFPADVVLISTSEPERLCYVETSNLDGETNLKIKQSHRATFDYTSAAQISALRGQLVCEQPNNSLYTFEGTMTINNGSTVIPLGPDQLLLRGAQLRNTSWIYGLVVFTGHDTKLMRNATKAPHKTTAMEKMVNRQIMFLLILLLVLSICCAIGSAIENHITADRTWYLMRDSSFNIGDFMKDILTFILTLNNLIPISLIVTMELVKFQHAYFINNDLDMYHAESDTAAVCRTSSLVEELGQIEYIFSDKTGTLTCNQMEFRQCSIAGIRYADVVDERRVGEVFSFDRVQENMGAHETAPHIRAFLTLLATCHTVIPEIKELDDGSAVIDYQASSPDEAALVSGARALGYTFLVRKPQSIQIDVLGEKQEFQVLNVLEFNSTRKRMSAILRTPEGRIVLYCKGADTVILERLAPEGQEFENATSTHLEDYATEGLRTLCISMREIPEEEYKEWSDIYEKAAQKVTGRSDAVDEACELIERDLFLLGATAIEDKLQDGVPETIYTLQQAGIKIWVLTGDRQETAISIGLSCRLISESTSLVIVNEATMRETHAFIARRLEAVKLSQKAGDYEELALVIDGKSLSYALDKAFALTFLELAVLCKSVICCRVSPLQKALVVKLVKKNMNSILLAIGDGANDVSMIQAAHVGVGISGMEGLQAARTADVAIAQFKYLKKLLLVHGMWSYVRLSKLILYSFYKNIALYMTGFWFAFQNMFSGQVLEEGWTLTFYNVVFTVLPPFVIGVFDQFVGIRMLDRYPELYKLGQTNHFFNTRIFWQWIANAVFHSIGIYYLTVGIFWNDLVLPQGWMAGQWFWGTTLYLAALLTVLGKAALVSDMWTKYTLLAIPGSFFFTMLFVPFYAWIAPVIGFSRVYTGLVPRLWTSLIFWLTIVGIPCFLLLRDFAWRAYKRIYHPEPYHIIQEIQKYNLPDHKPRMEQFQKAIKKVRATQRMRRNRGFAFSQTESGQERLIRAYDTSIAKEIR